MPLEIVTVPCLSDNYAYLLRDEGSGLVALVDAPEAGPIEAAICERGWGLDQILITHHHGDHIGGVNALLRYNFLGGSRFVPFLEIGVGVAGLELDLEDQADGLAFAPQGGLGLHWWLSRQLSLTAEWRLHHLSNADIHDDNAGINDSLLMVGLSWFP